MNNDKDFFAPTFCFYTRSELIISRIIRCRTHGEADSSFGVVVVVVVFFISYGPPTFPPEVAAAFELRTDTFIHHGSVRAESAEARVLIAGAGIEDWRWRWP